MRIIQHLFDVTTRSGIVEKKIYKDRIWFFLGDAWYYSGNCTNLGIRDKDSEFYTLASVVFLWDHRDDPNQAYVKAAQANHIRAVTRSDRASILEYLNGKKAREDLPESYSYYEEHKNRSIKSRQTIPDSQSCSSEHIDVINDQKTLTVEKVMELREKHSRHQAKRTTKDFPHLGASNGGFHAGVKLNERVWRTRNSVMQTSAKTFSNIVQIVNRVKAMEAAEKKKLEAIARCEIETVKTEEPSYSRYTQELFNKSLPFEGRQHQSFANGPFLEQISEVLANNHDLENYLDDNKSKAKNKQNDLSSNNNRSLPKHRTPIIVVPPSTSATIVSLRNIAPLLEDRHFTEMSENAVPTKTHRIVHRSRNESKTPYLVVEDPTKLKDEDWGRVVAVFAMGPAWQFKDWKWKSPVEIFARIPAFHAYYDDMKLHENISMWNVTPIPINRSKRHLDASMMIKFWEVVDRHIAQHAPFLRY